jgi:peptidoglycan/LPS O-acetylase OafA/YrhL
VNSKGADKAQMNPADEEWRLGHRTGLDELRGLAVLLVLWDHLTGGQHIGGEAGAVGVTIFFTLSGFLITRLLIEERSRTSRIAIRSFYQRRARRLLPALGLALPLCLVATAVEGVPWGLPLLSSTLYLANFAQLTVDMGSFGHLWSLAVEEHFYLLWRSPAGSWSATPTSHTRRRCSGPMACSWAVLWPC